MREPCIVCFGQVPALYLYRWGEPLLVNHPTKGAYHYIREQSGRVPNSREYQTKHLLPCWDLNHSIMSENSDEATLK